MFVLEVVPVIVDDPVFDDEMEVILPELVGAILRLEEIEPDVVD